MRSAEELTLLMAASQFSSEEQVRQIKFRQDLTEKWQIRAGARILEIGCGQGDMTAVLADLVGPEGHITAVDAAAPHYGAPVTLGDSASFLKAGRLGDRIDFRFEFDVLQEQFTEGKFDCIVMAHCTWYFESLSVLRSVLGRVRPWTSKLCISEWDLVAQSIEQTAHMLAVLIQGQVEAYRSVSESNVRTPYAREALSGLLSELDWEIESEKQVNAPELADATWEIDQCRRTCLSDTKSLLLPAKHLDLLRSQINLMNAAAALHGVRSLPAFAITAVRR